MPFGPRPGIQRHLSPPPLGVWEENHNSKENEIHKIVISKVKINIKYGAICFYIYFWLLPSPWKEPWQRPIPLLLIMLFLYLLRNANDRGLL
jgi:hypothetical protein